MLFQLRNQRCLDIQVPFKAYDWVLAMQWPCEEVVLLQYSSSCNNDFVHLQVVGETEASTAPAECRCTHSALRCSPSSDMRRALQFLQTCRFSSASSLQRAAGRRYTSSVEHCWVLCTTPGQAPSGSRAEERHHYALPCMKDV